ncbi:GRAM domain-containing protein 2A isoform X4 [Struthio camelus]
MHEKAAPLKSPEPMHGRDKLEASHKEKSLDSLDGSLHLNEALKDEDIKKCHREVAASKYNSQYHKLFKDIPTEESVLKVCSCALQRDILIQGRLYISPNWLCFYANLFGKDIKVVIPVVSVQLIKKHKTARLLPNGLAITTNASRKYIFVSLISRDSVYDVLRRVCTHLQVSSKKSLSLKEFTEEPDAVSLGYQLPGKGLGNQVQSLPAGLRSLSPPRPAAQGTRTRASNARFAVGFCFGPPWPRQPAQRSSPLCDASARDAPGPQDTASPTLLKHGSPTMCRVPLSARPYSRSRCGCVRPRVDAEQGCAAGRPHREVQVGAAGLLGLGRRLRHGHAVSCPRPSPSLFLALTKPRR